jgi:hypothetical protein
MFVNMSIVHCLCLPSLMMANSWAPGRRPRTKPLQPQPEQSTGHDTKSHRHPCDIHQQSHSHTHSKSRDTTIPIQTDPSRPLSIASEITNLIDACPLSAATDANEYPGPSRITLISEQLPAKAQPPNQNKGNFPDPKVRCTRAHLFDDTVFSSSSAPVPRCQPKHFRCHFSFWLFLLRFALYSLWLIVFSFVIKNKST